MEYIKIVSLNEFVKNYLNAITFYSYSYSDLYKLEYMDDHKDSYKF
jgi:hypothetical protein